MKKIIILLSLIIFITACGEKKDEDFEVNKANLNEGVIEDKVIDNFKTENTSVIYEKGITTFKTELSSLQETYIKQITVIFKSKNGNVLTTLVGYLNQNIKDKTDVVITSDIDLTNAYSIEYIFE